MIHTDYRFKKIYQIIIYKNIAKRFELQVHNISASNTLSLLIKVLQANIKLTTSSTLNVIT